MWWFSDNSFFLLSLLVPWKKKKHAMFSVLPWSRAGTIMHVVIKNHVLIEGICKCALCSINCNVALCTMACYSIPTEQLHVLQVTRPSPTCLSATHINIWEQSESRTATSTCILYLYELSCSAPSFLCSVVSSLSSRSTTWSSHISGSPSFPRRATQLGTFTLWIT